MAFVYRHVRTLFSNDQKNIRPIETIETNEWLLIVANHRDSIKSRETLRIYDCLSVSDA